MSSHPFTSCAAIEGKFRITGKVAGVDACQLVSDADEITVGSAITCDLVVTDPLVPRKAFRLLRHRDHYEADQECQTHWILEAFPGARVYVNNDLLRRGRVNLGDTISLGCHQLQFSVADPDARNWESNTKIDDLCDRLLRNGELPAGYLEGCPSWANRRRVRIATGWTTALVVLVAITAILTPRQEKFVQMQIPMEVVMLSEPLPDASISPLPSQGQRKSSPQPDAVRSLAQVQRKSIAQPDDPAAPSDILPGQLDSVKTLDSQPLTTGGAEQLAKPAAPQLEHLDVTASSMLPSFQVSRDDRPQVDVARTVAKLEASSQGQVRRYTLAEINDPIMQKELGPVGVEFVVGKLSSNATASVARPMNQFSGRVTDSVAKPGQVKLDSNRAGQLAALERYSASPVGKEQYRGGFIPVARLPGNLNPTGIDDERAALTGKSTGAVVLDGEVSDAEVAFSWKSGQFRTHGPGTPPPADPPTYCYVGKTEKNGKPYLYISFVCKDPNLDQLILRESTGSVHLTADDSIEVFLDTEMSRHHYYQMIVNARGDYWSSIVQNSGGGKYNIGPAWNPQKELKTTINKQAGRWTCEVLVPFDQLGGVPKKGSRWGVNFCRNFRGQSADDTHLQTWFLVYDKSRNFHNPELFGIFEW